VLVALTHTLYQEFDITKTIRKGIEMSKDLSLEKVMSLQQELEEALENYWHFLDVGDYRLADMWNEIVDQISKDIRSL
jgi:ribulose kinase